VGHFPSFDFDHPGERQAVYRDAILADIRSGKDDYRSESDYREKPLRPYMIGVSGKQEAKAMIRNLRDEVSGWQRTREEQARRASGLESMGLGDLEITETARRRVIALDDLISQVSSMR
jgi:hypothetical protein